MPGFWSIPDWRDASAYRLLAGADRTLLCWEWLRRSADYRADLAAGRGSERWGLVCFEDADRAVPFARPMWSASRFDGVLRARASTWPDDADAFRVSRYQAIVTLVSAGEGQHVLLSDGLQSLRLDVAGVPLEQGPILLSYVLRGFDQLTRPLVTLNRLRRFVQTGRIEPQRRSAHRQAREIMLLRAWDAIEAGASQRDIAGALFGGDAGSHGWRINDPSLRLRAQRLAKSARVMAAGNFWDLLR